MDQAMVFALITAVGFAICQAAPVHDDLSPEEQANAEDYLSQFYSTMSSGNKTGRKIAINSFATNLKSMQEFFGLEITGRLDLKTLDVMKKPRCGVPDVSRYGHFPGRPKWEKDTVTYRITQYTPDLSQREVDSTIAQAFKLFSDVTPLNFKQIYNGNADIMILFKGGYHGDFYPFDGPNGVLAHASSPGLDQGGDTHFDDDEQWTLSQRGINLLLVAAHEFGHALGLDHSRDRTALMYPTYQYVNTRGYKLPQDDRLGIQALYGVRTPSGKPPGKPHCKPDPAPDPKPEPKPEQCSPNLVFDAATSIRGELYFFKNGYYWKKSTLFQGIQSQTIKSTWPSISSVDAAYENKARDVTFLFEGKQYWGIKGTLLLSGYPKPISNFGFPSWVTEIDAAVYVSSTRRTLFFAKNNYWSFNEIRGEMDNGYPRSISQDLPGIGSKVDAAFENRRYLYFSDGARQTEYHYGSKRVNRVLLNYGWLDCY